MYINKDKLSEVHPIDSIYVNILVNTSIRMVH